jgi:DNA-binding winged helix-turn-helix (wHTH) protein
VNSGTFSNPYRCATAITDPANFYGRRQEVADIFGLIDGHSCVNIVGERRSGKTSLLHYIAHPEVRAKVLPHDEDAIYMLLNAQILSPLSPEGFYRYMLERILEQAENIPVNLNGRVNEREIIRALGALQMQNRRIVMLIDEFERVSQCEAFERRFFDVIRGLCTTFQLTFVIATSSRLYDCCPVDVATSPFPNIFRIVELGPFTPDEFHDFVAETSNKSGVPLTDVKSEIKRLAGHLPYFVQMACWHYYRAWADKNTFGPEMHERVQREFAHEISSHLQRIWMRHFKEDDRQVLQRLAQGETPDPDCPITWHLQRRGYVNASGITAEVMADFVRAQSPVRQVTIKRERKATHKGIWVDEDAGAVYIDGERLDPPLTDHQYKLMLLLWKNRGKICDNYMIVENVWSEEYVEDIEDQRIAQLTSRLRRRVEPNGRPWRYILTVHGRGLRLIANPDDNDA